MPRASIQQQNQPWATLRPRLSPPQERMYPGATSFRHLPRPPSALISVGNAQDTGVLRARGINRSLVFVQTGGSDKDSGKGIECTWNKDDT